MELLLIVKERNDQILFLDRFKSWRILNIKLMYLIPKLTVRPKNRRSNLDSETRIGPTPSKHGSAKIYKIDNYHFSSCTNAFRVGPCSRKAFGVRS